MKSSQARGQIGAAAVAYTTAIGTLDPSLLCDLCCSMQQHQILNPLSKARDQTCILTETVSVLNPLGHRGNSCSDTFKDPHTVSMTWIKYYSDKWRIGKKVFQGIGSRLHANIKSSNLNWNWWGDNSQKFHCILFNYHIISFLTSWTEAKAMAKGIYVNAYLEPYLYFFFT